MPLVVRGPLFGPGAIHGLDGDAHRWRRALFRRVLSDAGVCRLVDLADQEWTRAFADWESAGGGAVFDTAVGATQPLCSHDVSTSGIRLPPGRRRAEGHA